VALAAPPAWPGSLQSLPMERYDVVCAGRDRRELPSSVARAPGLAGRPGAGGPGANRARASGEVRAYALNAESVGLLRQLKVWDALPAHAATAVHDMHIEAMPPWKPRLLAWEQCVGELAWIVDAAVLERQLADATRFAPHLSIVGAEPAASGPAAALTALCEGKASATRDALGVRTERHAYGQRAIAARLVADRPHLNRALQWFRAPDVLRCCRWTRPSRGARLPSSGRCPTRARGHAEAGRGGVSRPRLAMPRAVPAARCAWPASGRHGRWRSPGPKSVRPAGCCWGCRARGASTLRPGPEPRPRDVVALAGVLGAARTWRSLGTRSCCVATCASARRRPGHGRLTDGLLHLFCQPAAGRAGTSQPRNDSGQSRRTAEALGSFRVRSALEPPPCFRRNPCACLPVSVSPAWPR